MALRGGMDPLPDDIQLDIDDSAQFRCAKRSEHDDVIEPVREFRSKPAPSSRHTRRGDLAVQFCLVHAIAGTGDMKPEPWRSHVAHLGRAEIACHEDHALGKIDAPIVTQSQRGFVEDAQRQIPE